MSKMYPLAVFISKQVSKVISAQALPLDEKFIDACLTQVRFLQEFLNGEATLTERQAYEVAGLIVRRTMKRQDISDMEMVQLATYINTCKV